MTAGTVRTSTRGGRSVLRSAAAVEAAALRSLTLGASMPLPVFANPLSSLLGDVLDLSVLDRLVGASSDPHPVRRSAGGQPTSGSSHAGTAAHRGGTGSGTAAAAAGAGAPAPRGIGAAGASSAGALQPAAGVGSSVAAARTGKPAAGNAARPAAPEPRSPGTTRNTASAVSAAPAADRPGAATSPAADPDPARVPAHPSTNVLRQAARSGSRAAAAPEVGQTPATRTHSPTGRASERGNHTGGASGSSQRMSASGSPIRGDLTSTAPTGPAAAYPDLSSAPTTARREFSGSGLAELVARWQDGEGPGAPDAPDAGSSSGSPVWTPLSSTTFDHERPLRLDDEDRIEAVLEQILRRDVERHGLEGGR